MRLRTRQLFLLLWIVLQPLFQSSLLAQTGIQGTVPLDTSVWAPVAYLSIIPDFTQMNTMSYETIIDRADIDSMGHFSFQQNILPAEDHLYRIHISKKGDPPASLIIGGRDHNHLFLIANNHDPVGILIEEGNNLINNVDFEGYPPNLAWQEINEMVSLLDTLDYYGSTSNREFIREAVDEKLRSYADTCSHPLISLYALYLSKFESDYPANPGFYKSFLRKWKGEDSEYFQVFRSQLQIQKPKTFLIILIILAGLLIAGTLITIFSYRSKRIRKDPYTSLTVQERKIFSLLKEGKSNKEISDECAISISTVKSHINSIYSKLQLSSRKEVMDYSSKNE